MSHALHALDRALRGDPGGLDAGNAGGPTELGLWIWAGIAHFRIVAAATTSWRIPRCMSLEYLAGPGVPG